MKKPVYFKVTFPARENAFQFGRRRWIRMLMGMEIPLLPNIFHEVGQYASNYEVWVFDILVKIKMRQEIHN